MSQRYVLPTHEEGEEERLLEDEGVQDDDDRGAILAFEQELDADFRGLGRPTPNKGGPSSTLCLAYGQAYR